jgi:predicted transcriptional regulator
MRAKTKPRSSRKSAAKRRMTDAEILAELPPLTDEEKTRLIEEGMADIRAGRVVEHAAVVAWMKSWGTGKELPMPKPKRRIVGAGR